VNAQLFFPYTGFQLGGAGPSFENYPPMGHETRNINTFGNRLPLFKPYMIDHFGRIMLEFGLHNINHYPTTFVIIMILVFYNLEL
jgi:hypothetical protein